jgi:hypothetical protein
VYTPIQPQTKTCIITEALLRVRTPLGLTLADLSRLTGQLGIGQPSVVIEPRSTAGAAALQLIRCHRVLFQLVGQDATVYQHWLTTWNVHTKGIPALQIKTKSGLAQVLGYLEGLRADAR